MLGVGLGDSDRRGSLLLVEDTIGDTSDHRSLRSAGVGLTLLAGRVGWHATL